MKYLTLILILAAATFAYAMSPQLQSRSDITNSRLLVKPPTTNSRLQFKPATTNSRPQVPAPFQHTLCVQIAMYAALHLRHVYLTVKAATFHALLTIYLVVVMVAATLTNSSGASSTSGGTIVTVVTSSSSTFKAQTQVQLFTKFLTMTTAILIYLVVHM
ncbi:5041_t:CDS:2 [Paraglomus brasilianum]|uniref:5041_t:CDS:1 n=1 Tax=Paraglomus brasilianum TaxID=144538 RepID=A0A9N9B867_9GLOM|nr:5041_t:CDS:2 [Paraglomus brasilianum]